MRRSCPRTTGTRAKGNRRTRRGSKWAATPVGRVERGGFERPQGVNAPDEGAEKGEDIVENVMRDENDIGAQEPEEQDENPPALAPLGASVRPGGCQEDAPEEGEKRVPIGDASADAAGSPVEPAKEPESNTMDQGAVRGNATVVAANSADASGSLGRCGPRQHAEDGSARDLAATAGDQVQGLLPGGRLLEPP